MKKEMPVTHTGVIRDPYFKDPAEWSINATFDPEDPDPQGYCRVQNGKLELVDCLAQVTQANEIVPEEGDLIFYEIAVDVAVAVPSVSYIAFASNYIWTPAMGTGLFTGHIDKEWSYNEGLKIDVRSFSIPQWWQARLTLSRLVISIHGDVGGRGRGRS